MAQPAKVLDLGVGPYRIQAAAELSGVPAATLRAWERRYGVPVPRRTSSAYRLYTADDVRMIARMRELVESGISPADAARSLVGAPIAEAEAAPERDAMELAQTRLLGATQRWDARAIDEELLRLSMLVDTVTLYDRVVAPVLAEVGRRWQAGELSVAQEHLLSEKLEATLRAGLRAGERAEGPLVVLTTVEGDEHVLGMLGAALRFSSAGLRVTCLGASTPPRALGEAVRSMSPRLVGLSVTIAPPRPREFFRAYGRACGEAPWVVGGPKAVAVASAVASAGGKVATTATEWTTGLREWLRR